MSRYCCLIISYIASISLSAFTQEQCVSIVIDGVYLSDVNEPGDTMILSATNTINSIGCTFPNPSWKIKNNDNDLYFGVEDISGTTTSACLTDREYFSVSKDSTNANNNNINAGDIVSLTVELWVNNNGQQELACSYPWDIKIDYNKCDEVLINDLYLADDYIETNTLTLDTSLAVFLDCDLPYPTWEIYDNNNQLFGRMMRMAQTFCLEDDKDFPINITSTTFTPGDSVSLTIELWLNWQSFSCAFQWDGELNYKQATSDPTIDPTTDPTTVPTTTDPTIDPTTDPTTDPITTVTSTLSPSTTDVAPTELDRSSTTQVATTRDEIDESSTTEFEVPSPTAAAYGRSLWSALTAIMISMIMTLKL